MDQNININDNFKNEPEVNYIWFIAASITLHLLVIGLGALDISFGTKKRDFQKSSLNVAIVEESPKSKSPLKKIDSIKGKKVNIEEKKREIKKKAIIKDKKPLIIQKKKRLSSIKKSIKKEKIEHKKNNVSKKKEDIKNIISSFKKDLNKDVEKERNSDKIAKEIEEFRKDISTNNNPKEKGLLTGISEGAKAAQIIDRYRYKVAYQVEKKWALPSELVNSDDFLEASVVISVDKQGKIVNIWFDKKSGNKFFDQSVYRAVQKADPVSPHPKDIKKGIIDVGFRFTPQGLR